MQLNEVQIITIFRYYFQPPSPHCNMLSCQVARYSMIVKHIYVYLFFGYRVPQNEAGKALYACNFQLVPLVNKDARSASTDSMRAAAGAAREAFSYKNKTKTRKFLSL